MQDASEVAAKREAAQAREAREAYQRDLSRWEAEQASIASEASAGKARERAERPPAHGTPRERWEVHPKAGWGRGLALGQLGTKRRSTLAKRKAPRLRQSRLDLDTHTPADTFKASALWGPGCLPPIVAVYVRGRCKARYEIRAGVYHRID